MPQATDARSDELFRWADQIPTPLWDDLRTRAGEQAAAAVEGVFEQNRFKVPMLGTVYRVDPAAQRIQHEQDPDHRVSYQSGVVLLTALAKSMGVPPSGRMVTPLELEGGTLFFTGAHTLATKPLADHFGRSPRSLVKAARALGGESVDGADCAIRLPGLPLIPLYVLLWTADEEFEARAVIGIDDRALFHLDLAGVFALTNVMVAKLTKK
ncbi:MAG: DUF3786 domain-containing protein [Desulfatitalea sp.]|nr:DUF3786 domain-containing protein [Desulfatitalea sp.]NNJ99570.1 DUF3786 domain-containing protein [Desulfatitalea sp.]